MRVPLRTGKPATRREGEQMRHPLLLRAALGSAGLAACVALLGPVLDEVVRIGGSHAQREIIEDTFVVALIRSGELKRAQALLDARLHRRPSPRDTRWQALVA